MDQENRLQSMIADKINQCQRRQIITRTHFLDPFQRSLAESFCKKYNFSRFHFWGGYPSAERTIAFFLPDDHYDYFTDASSIDNDLKVIYVISNGPRKLSHRDYLGAILALGVRREMIGDILVLPDTCQIIIENSIAEFLLNNFLQAGNSSLNISIIEFDQLKIPENSTVKKQVTVASLRLDVMLAAAYDLSRKEAANKIAASLVAVNNRPTNKQDLIINEGDKISLRGKGKFILSRINNLTKKGRYSVTIEKLI